MVSSAVVQGPIPNSKNVGPIAPEQDASVALDQAIRSIQKAIAKENPSSKSKLQAQFRNQIETLMRNVYPVDEEDDSTFHGFTDTVNNGQGIFQPIRPGVEVTSARQLDETSEPESTDDATPSTNQGTQTTTPPGATTSTPATPGTPAVGGNRPGAQTGPAVTPPINNITPAPTADGDNNNPSPSVAPATPTNPDASTGTPAGTGAAPPQTNPNTPTDTTSGTESTEADDGDADNTDDADDGSSGLPLPTGVDGGEDDEEPSPSESDDGVCFPADATVELENGNIKKMMDVELGDRVRVGTNSFSEVFMFTHRLANVKHSFVNILTNSGNELSLTKSHYLYVNGILSAAETLKQGDSVTLANGSIDTVISVKEISSQGLYNPQTVQGDIVVNGVLASTYTKTVNPTTAHAFLAPLRMVYESMGYSLSAFEAGAGFLASIVPSGPLVM